MSRRRKHVDAQEFAGMLVRLMRAYRRRAEAGETEPADLADLYAIRTELDAVVTATVIAAKVAGFSWAEIGGATGTSRQAAEQRWGRAVRAARRTRPGAVNAGLTPDQHSTDKGNGR